ncbi:MAG: hypothetical protein LBM25_05040 [Bacteroidales bacterium]|jgi:hypothetical protein|nr:hypothetical protein [Bacteroidales bacterium]
MKKSVYSGLIIAIFISLFIGVYNTTMMHIKENRLEKKFEDRIFFEKSVANFTRNNTTLDNPNPFDSVYSNNDTIFFYKNGKNVGIVSRKTETSINLDKGSITMKIDTIFN